MQTSEEILASFSEAIDTGQGKRQDLAWRNAVSNEIKELFADQQKLEAEIKILTGAEPKLTASDASVLKEKIESSNNVLTEQVQKLLAANKEQAKLNDKSKRI